MRLPNGYGGVSKLSGNRRRPYVARITVSYRDTGTPIYKTLGYFAKKEEALQELVKYNQTKYNVDQKKLTFAEIYKDWSDSHYKEISQSAINGYKMAYKKCTKIHNIRFADIRTVHLQRVIDEDCETYSIRKSVRVLLNVLYKYAMKNDIVEKQYSKYISIGKPVKVYEKIPFSDEEIEEIWNNKDTINGIDTVLILIYTGMRINELLQIENAKMNFEERYMIGGEKTEAGRDRVIPISTKILPLIKARYNPDNKYLIVDDQGKPISYYAYKRYIWEPVMEELKLPNPHTPHTTRHTTVTMLSNARGENGEPIDTLTIKYILGHKTDTDITERYTHRRIEQLVAAIDLI